MSLTLQFYRDRAAQARTDAASASLDNVRDRWLCAADAWDAMAARVARTERGRAEVAATKAAAALV